MVASVSPLVHPSLQSLIPDVVEKARLARANASMSTAEQLIQIAAPVVAGVLVAMLGAAQAVLINAGLFLAAAGVLCGLPEARREKQTVRRSIWGQVSEGWQVAWAQPVFWCFI